MIQEWFILIEGGKQEGPFTELELRKHPFVTPDTLVWKEGFDGWVAIRYVPELKEIFKDDPESIPVEDIIKPKKLPLDLKNEQDVLALQSDPMQFFIWVLIIILILFYIYYHFYGYVR